MKRLKQYSFWEYMRVLLVFIAGLAVSLLVFSYNVQVRTEQNVEELLDYNTDHQQSQLKFMLNTQFIYLSNIADYVAKEDSLMCEKNQELLSCMTQDTLFHAISIIDTDGNGVTNDGKEQKVADRDYFKRTMKSEEVLSDPLYSSLDGKRRVVLCVPGSSQITTNRQKPISASRMPHRLWKTHRPTLQSGTRVLSANWWRL